MDIRGFFGGTTRNSTNAVNSIAAKDDKVQSKSPELKRKKVVSDDLVDWDGKNELGRSVGRNKLKTTADGGDVASPAHIQRSVAEESVSSVKKAVVEKSPRKETSTQLSPPASESKPSKYRYKEANAQDGVSAKPTKPTAKSGACFEDMRIAVSGIFGRMSREDVEEFILSRGGKIATSVTGKTSFLVAGSRLEDGRAVNEGSKYRTALEKKVRIMPEDDFFSQYGAVPVMAPKAVQVVSASSFSAANALAPAATKSTTDENAYLWVDKYKPQTPADLIGHAEMCRKLETWLNNWDAWHLHKTSKPPFSKENCGAKAVLLSGPPGIGKTSLATIVARSLGYEAMELNASDTRNKRELDDKLIEAVSTRAISVGKQTKRLVIMDEVDGMGGSDRGGMAELIKIIKGARIPVICICNDRQSPKIRSLANHCYDLRVKRPTRAQIGQRLVAIAAKEGLSVDANAAEMLVEQAGNDIRQALNALQMWSYGTGSLSYTDLKQGKGRIEKDKVLRQTPFDACLALVSGGKTAWEERYGAYFIDYSLVPLPVQQNYVDAAKNGICRNPPLGEAAKLDAVCKVAEAVSDMDVVGSHIRGQDQH